MIEQTQEETNTTADLIARACDADNHGGHNTRRDMSTPLDWHPVTIHELARWANRAGLTA